MGTPNIAIKTHRLAKKTRYFWCCNIRERTSRGISPRPQEKVTKGTNEYESFRHMRWADTRYVMCNPT